MHFDMGRNVRFMSLGTFGWRHLSVLGCHCCFLSMCSVMWQGDYLCGFVCSLISFEFRSIECRRVAWYVYNLQKIAIFIGDKPLVFVSFFVECIDSNIFYLVFAQFTLSLYVYILQHFHSFSFNSLIWLYSKYTYFR